MSQPVEEKQKKKSEKGKAKAFKIGEFLQAPRKKRKQYVQVAVGANFDKDLAAAMQNFIKKQFPGHAISLPNSIVDFKRQAARNIIFSIVDDEFAAIGEVLECVKALKTRKSDHGMPILFLTKKPAELVDEYRKVLLAYQENDDFVDYASTTTEQILSRIKIGVERKNMRRSRRYKIDIPISCYHLGKNSQLAAKLIDMSAHGALLRADREAQFRIGDQLRLSIPVAHYLPPSSGDFLKVSARVRRVFISGDTVGVSFEFVSDHLALQLAEFITSLVNSQLARSGVPTTTKRV